MSEKRILSKHPIEKITFDISFTPLLNQEGGDDTLNNGFTSASIYSGISGSINYSSSYASASVATTFESGSVGNTYKFLHVGRTVSGSVYKGTIYTMVEDE